MPLPLNPPSTLSPRDGRLDVLRGLCLTNMVLVHLIWQGMVTPWLFSEAILNWLRFAAGGFVMTSGLCIGAIHYRRALDPARRGKAYFSLVKRSGFVLLVHYFATFLSLTLIPIHGEAVHNVGGMVHDVLVFYTGYDLLLFYVFMLLISPLIIEATRRIGARWVLLASVGVFFWHYDNPYLSLWAVERDFPLVRWQLIFVIGLLVGSRLTQFDAMSATAKSLFFLGAVSTSLAIGTLSAFERAGLIAAPWWLAVTKMPLSILEVAHYVAMAVALGIAADRLWPRLAGTKSERFLTAIGVQSLMLWVAHVPIVANVAHLPWPVAIALSLAGVWLVARAGTAVARQWAESAHNLPKLAYLVPAIGSIAIVVFLGRIETPVSTLAIVPAAIPSAATGQSASMDEATDTELPIPIDDDSLSDTA